MRIRLAYGKTGRTLELSDRCKAEVVEPRFVPGVAVPQLALADALQHPLDSAPLCELVKTSDRVGIVFSDLTRPTPNQLLIPAVLDSLNHVPASQITLFNALGTHRRNTPEELGRMLGEELAAGFRIVQNDAFDATSQVMLGVSRWGHEIWLNRELAECDFRILTGFIEPHFFAGFSGGGKAVMPGMAGVTTVLGNHDAGMIASPKAAWGITKGNPIWEEIQEAAAAVGPSFLLNVSLNKHKEITGVFAGQLRAAHQAGCAFVKQTAMTPVAQPFDIVVATNSGYPLDLNLYQAVKGMSAAAQVVRTGGSIIVAAECWDGIPEHGLYGRLLREGGSPRGVLEMIQAPGFLKQDQWQVQIQAQIQLQAEVYVYSDCLSDEQIEAALLRPCRNLERTVDDLLSKYGPSARVCVLPEGPQTVPYVSR
jgi:nickel-dependent lactate racemase